jgi:hypothetical protein
MEFKFMLTNKQSTDKFYVIKLDVKEQAHEKVYEIMFWDVSFGFNWGLPTTFNILKPPV